jgi:ABC-type branched-subunit amino acid transport system ATPase component
MPYNIQTRIVIQSATLELTGAQRQELAMAEPFLEEAVVLADDEVVAGLRPVSELLKSIAALVNNATIVTSGKKPESEAQRLARIARAAKAREIYAAGKANPNPTPGA